uniref:Biotin carboxyl carrier protein of acetyl-CoA carboxylase n=1 Tax=Bostrychia moritziana TaxID=103713 RepID=A0A1Z1M6W2_BOSMO|nr:acetyl-CoA carboxylase biotin carboxyl carrier protein [Bostrychia moritziana]ARW61690.1 acetyl-CoA carboxylase biotin carboxyl carrier protein [Bostrychia moritziana]
MKLKLKDIKTFINSIETYKINQILVRTKEVKILINKVKKENYSYTNANCRNNILYSHNNDKYLEINTSNEYSPNSSIVESEELNENSKTYSTIVSPMVGTFYRCPAPNEPPFVEKNDTVKQKQTVCIIEAMKLMNEIEAEVSGEIVDILVKDGDIVDCGQALIKVRIT